MFEEIIPIVLHHHERFDGKGYPNGLFGENIPYLARIVSVADAYDAMTTKRSYRNALPIEVAIAELKKCSGMQFEPKIVDAFVDIIVDSISE